MIGWRPLVCQQSICESYFTNRTTTTVFFLSSKFWMYMKRVQVNVTASNSTRNKIKPENIPVQATGQVALLSLRKRPETQNYTCCKPSSTSQQLERLTENNRCCSFRKLILQPHTDVEECLRAVEINPAAGSGVRPAPESRNLMSLLLLPSQDWITPQLFFSIPQWLVSATYKGSQWPLSTQGWGFKLGEEEGE